MMTVQGGAQFLAQMAEDALPLRSVPGERVSVLAGDIFEIVAVTDAVEPEYTWVLTQDRTFIQADRSRVFRVRLVTPGTYRLDAAVHTADLSTQARRTILIEVVARAAVLPPASSTGTAVPPVSAHPDAKILTVPSSQDGTLELSGWVRILKIVPDPAAVSSVHVDLNTAIDGDGNGDPGDDHDTADTYASVDGSPLFLWFAADPPDRPDGGPAGRVIRISLANPGGMTVTHTITLRNANTGVAPPANGTIDARAQEDASVLFQLGLDWAGAESPPLLYEWHFGDGNQSLQYAPRHRYAESGTYPVQVVVRNLQTGQKVLETNTSVQITVTPATETGATTSPQPSPPPPAPKPPSGENGGWSLPTLPISGTAIVILIIALLIVAAIVWALIRMTRRAGGLPKTIEDAEARFVSGKAASTGNGVIDVAPPPLSLRRSAADEPAAMEQTQVKEKQEPSQQPALEPVIDIQAAPDWLRQGLTSSQPATGGKPPEEDRPVPPPAPLPAAPVAVDESAAEATPPWLQAAEEATTIPEQPSPPEGGAIAEPTTEPAPPVDDGSLPPWLQTNSPQQPPEETPEQEDSLPAEPLSDISSPPSGSRSPASTELPHPPPPPPSPSPASSTTNPPKTSPTPGANATRPPAPVASPEDDRQLERERERRRLKRQRYRDNLKKRKDAERQTSLPTPPTSPAPSRAPASTPPKTTAAEGGTKTTAVVPAMPAPPATRTEAAPKQVLEMPPLPPPPVDEMPLPPPAPAAPAPSVAPDVQPEDSDVAFVISADSVSGDGSNGDNPPPGTPPA
ncbi:MAG: hypothetical protein Greene041619_779 [Candidatus Peregrinibacteria bacterium Greene0416_19]|nr:MAG: hypothetical protein Greene041619_779 [Candidatus Peregrinibacteria bacterium Greene0416_19]